MRSDFFISCDVGKKTHQTKLLVIQALFQVNETKLMPDPHHWCQSPQFRTFPAGAHPLQCVSAPLCIAGALCGCLHTPVSLGSVPGSVGWCLSAFRYLQCIDLNVTIYVCWEQLER